MRNKGLSFEDTYMISDVLSPVISMATAGPSVLSVDMCIFSA